MNATEFDIIVIGSGPAGQKAAVQGAKAGKRIALVERDRAVGGHCVHRGTIPSKTLRHSAVRIAQLRQYQQRYSFRMPDDITMASLIENLDSVIDSHDRYINDQLARNNIVHFHGQASFRDNHHLLVKSPGNKEVLLWGENIIIATGSYPRKATSIDVDHENIYDSDSFLSQVYLPGSLTVLGGGVIASEYASIFLALGVRVTMIDKYPRPLGFLDSDLTDRFIHSFESRGGRFIGSVEVESASWNGIDKVVTRLSTGEAVESDKLLSAAGRIANVKGLNIEAAGLELNAQQVIEVDAQCRTSVPNIYAAGDVIGPPALASASMEQGRRASRAALSLDLTGITNTIPMGIYGIPEMSAVGLTEDQAIAKYGSAVVGHANFEEIARGQISQAQDGMLKLVADPSGQKLLGVHILGEGATELVHIGQMALLYNPAIDNFVENIFNFPTMAEAYRVAALKVVGQRQCINLAS